MNNRVHFAAIAAASLVVSAMFAPAEARGGGGFGGRGGFAAHGTTTRSRSTVTQRANGVTTRTTTTTTTTTRTARTTPASHALALIRPEVITVPATFGTGALVPPFTGVPIVPPFGATTVSAQFNRLPIVTTPFGYGSGFGYATWLQPEAAGFAEPSSVAAPPAAALPDTGAAAASPAPASSPLAACHPVANGYHCDWPS